MGQDEGLFPGRILLLLLTTLTGFSCEMSVKNGGVRTKLTQSLPSTIVSPTPSVTPPPSPTVTVTGNTYYVSKTGNDNNLGTISSPFLTIQKATDIVTAGDTVIVDDGVYTAPGTGESVALVWIKRTGTAQKPIIFKSKNKWGAILDGQNRVHEAITLTDSASYIKILDFDIKNFVYGGIGCNDQQYQSNYVTIQGNKIHDIGRHDSTSDYGRGAIGAKYKNHHWTVDRNVMFNIGRTGPSDYWMNKDHVIYWGATDRPENAGHHMVVTNNIMWGCSGAAITSGSNNDLIANNVIAWSNENSKGGSPFIAPDSDVSDLTIVNNIFYQPPVSNPYAILNLGNIIRWTVKNNIVYGGTMWPWEDAIYRASMGGNNYCKTDCEKSEVDPKFVSAVRSNALNADFSLQPLSPAINAGIDVGLTTDYLGKSLVGLPDIGAFEH